MRACAHCGVSIEARRPQARFCCGACRAAYRGSRRASRSGSRHGTDALPKPHSNRTEDVARDDTYRLATPEEEERIVRLVRAHAGSIE